MKVCNVYVERQPDSFLKLTVLVKLAWYKRRTSFVTYKLATKLKRDWYDKNNKLVGGNKSMKLTDSLNAYFARGGQVVNL